MPYAMKIQPIDYYEVEEPMAKSEAVSKPVFKSRFKWLFERPFSSGVRAPMPENPVSAAELLNNKDGLDEFEPSSVCLAKMVQNFIEENNDKQQQRCGRNRCICFNGNCTDSSDDELDSYNTSFSEACDALKSLVSCVCVSERNLLADTAKIVERHKINKRKDRFCRKIVAEGLIALGYDASICKSKWEKSPSFLAGEYEYVDVVMEGERLIIDIDFRSEFAVARPTKPYKLVLQTLPNIFIGKSDRLEKIIAIVSDAAKQSLKKKGMPLPPWRKAEYVKSKWLSPFTRVFPSAALSLTSPETQVESEREETLVVKKIPHVTESELIVGGKSSSPDKSGDSVFVFSNSNSSSGISCQENGGVEVAMPLQTKWELPQIRPKNPNKGVKIVTGLASVIDNIP